MYNICTVDIPLWVLFCFVFLSGLSLAVLVPREVFMKLLQSLVAQVSLRTQGGIWR